MAVLLCQLNGSARIRILIAAAALHEKRRDAGMRRLEVLLRVAGVIAGKLVERERRVVAGVTEKHRAQFSIHIFDAQHRHVLIDSAFGVRKIIVVRTNERPAVHSEAAARMLITQFRRVAIRERTAHQLDQLCLQLAAIFQARLRARSFLLAEHGPILRTRTHPKLRPAVRVRAIH